MNEQPRNFNLGDKIYFEGEKRPYKVRAYNKRYVVCTKPHNPMNTVLYTIIDLEENIRGPENLLFGEGFETNQQCWNAIHRLHGFPEHDVPPESTVSHINRVPLLIERVTRKVIKIKNVFVPYLEDGEVDLPPPEVDGFEMITSSLITLDGQPYDKYEYIPHWVSLCAGGNAERIRGNKIRIHDFLPARPQAS